MTDVTNSGSPRYCDLAGELEHFDQLTADRRDIQSLETLWSGDLVPDDVAGCIPAWSEAYLIAKQRARLPAGDQHDGRTVAFLEGLLAGLRMGARFPIERSESKSPWADFRPVDNHGRRLGDEGYGSSEPTNPPTGEASS